VGTTWDRRQWRDADSLAAIGELTARWLEGTLAYRPEDFATTPAPETRPLVPALAPLNRVGYVTTNSQPGVALRAGTGQRAFVTGCCDELSLRRLERAVRDTDLVLVAFRLDEGAGEPAVVTMRDGREATLVGRSASVDYIRREWDQDVTPARVAVRLGAWQLLSARMGQAFDAPPQRARRTSARRSS